MQSRYGRIFTEMDMIDFAHKMTQDNAGMDRGMAESRICNELAGYTSTFPEEEPVFVIRAKDALALAAVRNYRTHAERIIRIRKAAGGAVFLRMLDEAVDAFDKFRTQYHDRMAIPD